MNTNSSNRRWIWIVGIAVAVLYFGPQAMQSFRQAALYRQSLNSQPQNAHSVAAFTGQAQPVGAAATAPASVKTPVNTLLGTWQGQQAQADRELCQLGLEIREGSPGMLSGYAKVTCWPLVPDVPGRSRITNVVRSLSPASAVLTGQMKDGAVAFQIDKTIGASVEGCVLTAFSVTAFGNDQIAAEWQRDHCGKGQMVARRMGR